MGNEWIFERPSDVYTIVKRNLHSHFIGKYPDLYITQELRSLDDVQLPTVVIHFLGSPEIGNDIQGEDICGMLLTAEYRVTVSGDMGISVAREISTEIVSEFKKLRFSVTASAEFNYEANGTVVMVGRLRRIFGAGDTI